MDVYIDGKLYRLTAAKAIGKGGEADVYDLGDGRVAKIYKQPDHPDYAGLPAEQKAAEHRIKTHQTKLRMFPINLPPRVVAPEELVVNKSSSEILGFTMPFLKGTKVLMNYAERSFRSAGISNGVVTRIFRDLHDTVGGVHRAGVVIGDFNDLNVLVAGEQAYMIDADSMQFGKFPCGVFTARFVDPTLCDAKAHSPLLLKPHTAASDWYAYNVMLMQCLLFVGPYGGVFKPKNQAKKIGHDARPLHRITVFHPEVKYPKPATRYDVLPDDLLDHFHKVFEKDLRCDFPERLLEMQWTTCSKCGLEFARGACPVCATPAPAQVKMTITVRGTVTSERFFETAGRIVFATLQGGKFLYLYNENGKFYREGGREVVSGTVDPLMRFRIRGADTLIAQGHQLATFGRDTDTQVVDTYHDIPVFDANEDSRFFVRAGNLYRFHTLLGAVSMGRVLEDQTMFWTGEKLGFGFYRAEKLSVAFVFRTDGTKINDTVKLPQIRGQLLDSTCYFSKDRIWFAYAAHEAGVIKNQMVVLKGDGTVEATAEATAGDGSWLGNLRGKAAAGNYLFSATDDGIVRLEADRGTVSVTKEFPDTEPFVDTGCHLFPAAQGLYVVSSKEIRLLKIK